MSGNHDIGTRRQLVFDMGGTRKFINTTGFVFIIIVLYVFNRLIVVRSPQKIVIKFVKEEISAERIGQAITKLNIDAEMIAYDSETYGDEFISKITYKIRSKDFDFDEFIRSISNIPNVISVHKTNL